MSRPTLAAYTYVYNCRRIDYPFVESIQSSLLIADRVFVCDAFSTDGTWEVLTHLARTDPRLEIMQHPWGTHYRIQGQICNGILEGIGTRYDYAIQIQGDEIVCEWSVEPFRRDLEIMRRDGWKLGRPKYVHLCPDYHTRFPFIYERKAVLSRTDGRIRYDRDSDACSLAGAPWYDSSLEIMHVGKVQMGREREALVKELTMQEMYRSLGCFPDPKFVAQRERGTVDYREAFTAAEFTRYTGPWPAVLLPRIIKAEGRWPV